VFTQILDRIARRNSRAIKTNTCLIVSIDGVDRRLTAEDLKKMRSLEAN